jgi:SpoVK/Ycf46/Vps4 family AAA+-type ATPase
MELFKAIAAEDLFAAKSAAIQVCKAEESNGHRTAARQLRGALLSGNGASSGLPSPTQPGGVMSTALVRLTDAKTLSDVVLAPSARAELNSIIAEWTNGAVLRERGISPRSKLLFHGPPGCGKSLTAQALGHALDLPVYMVRFDAVIGAFLGQTAIHLRQLFHFAETTACVLLLDELDALGKRRGNPLDVGELDRIVISLLQELEHSKPAGIVIGTTNLAKHLDDALWRRFDLDLFFKPPTAIVLRRFAKRIAGEKHIKLQSDVLHRAALASSFAAAERVVVSEVRKQVLKPLMDKSNGDTA